MEASSKHEAICNRCGECCRIKVITPDGRPMPSAEFCPCLDLETKRCRVYEHRFSVLQLVDGNHCMTVTDAIMRCLVPPSCAYVPKRFPSMEFDAELYRKSVAWPDRLRLKAQVVAGRKKLKRLLKEHPEWKGESGRT